MIDKGLQMLILQEAAAHYPHPIPTGMPKFLEAIHNKTMRERLFLIAVNLHALQDVGYVKGATYVDYDGGLRMNKTFSLTGDGLVAAGVETLRPDPYAELRDALWEQAQALRALSEAEKITLKDMVRRMPLDMLKRVRDKGIDKLFSLLLD